MDRRNLLKLLPLSGVASMLDFSNLFAADGCLTSSDIPGPYYKPDAPFIKDISGQDTGPKLYVSGTIFASDCISPLPDVTLEVWQADSKAQYHDGSFRAKITTDHNGHYAFKTVLPGKYLNGNYYRPRHLHYKIKADGVEYLTTQIYFQGDSSIPQDPWASDPSAQMRIISLTEDQQGSYHGIANITIQKARPLGLDPDSVNQNAFQVFPSPAMGDELNIVFARGGVGKLVITDINGRVMIRKDIDFSINPNQTINLADGNGIRYARGLYIMYFLSATGINPLVKRFIIA